MNFEKKDPQRVMGITGQWTLNGFIHEGKYILNETKKYIVTFLLSTLMEKKIACT